MGNKTRHKLRIKRVYDQPSPDDGERFLVDRLWPRGLKKDKLLMTDWLKEVAPSPSLRVWFGHEVTKFAEFRRRYRLELAKDPAAWHPLLEAIQANNVTLLFAARDPAINHAVVLQEFLEEKLKCK